jgi:putative transposase
MNARDPNLFPADENAGQRPMENCFSVGRNDALHIVNVGDLPVEPGLHRVVWANRKSGNAFLLRFPNQREQGEVSTGTKRVKQRLHMPTQVSLAVLEDMGNKRWIVKSRAPVPKRLNKQFDNPTDFESKVRARRKVLVSSFMSDDDLIRIFEQGEMGRYVTRAVDLHNATLDDDDEKLTRHTVYQAVYRFWLHCCREAGLLPDSGNCGAPGKYRNPGSKKRGRPRKRVITGHAPDQIGLNTGPETRDLIWLAWEQYAGKIGKYAEPYERMVEDHFTEGWKENEQGLWVPDKELIVDAPSLETFRYYVNKKYSPIELYRKLIPAITFEQTKRAIRGKAHDKLFGPAQTYMVDSTIADVYLVSQFNRHWIIGRPIVYFIRDVWSGMIVGLHVALEGPSWHTARFALFNAFSAKGSFLRAHGFDMTDQDWPCAHGTVNLIHDRGESLSIASSDSANDLRLVLSACPSFRPDVKGPIETLFHWIRNETVRWLPGAVSSRARERGERDNRLDATLTMYQFTRILIRAILSFNRHADVSDRFDRAMEEAGVENNPQAIWNWGLKNLNGSPQHWDRDDLYASLLPSADAYVRGDGVYFAGRRYQGEFSDKAQWQEFARVCHNKKINVKHDSVRPEEIYVLNEASGQYETLYLAPGEKVQKGARLEDIVDYKEYRSLVKEDDKDVRLLDKISSRKFLQNEVDLAIKARDTQIPPSTKAEHLAGITDKRWLEAEVRRLHDAALAGRFGDMETGDAGDIEDELAGQSDLLSQLLAKNAEEMTHVAID